MLVALFPLVLRFGSGLYTKGKSNEGSDLQSENQLKRKKTQHTKDLTWANIHMTSRHSQQHHKASYSVMHNRALRMHVTLKALMLPLSTVLNPKCVSAAGHAVPYAAASRAQSCVINVKWISWSLSVFVWQQTETRHGLLLILKLLSLNVVQVLGYSVIHSPTWWQFETL